MYTVAGFSRVHSCLLNEAVYAVTLGTRLKVLQKCLT